MIERFRYKNISETPVLDCIPDNYKTQETDVFAFYMLAYSNRILFKSAIRIREHLQLHINLHTQHTRLLILIQYVQAAKKNKHGTGQSDILQADYLSKDKRKWRSVQELKETGLVIEKKTPKTALLSLSDKGKIALQLIKDIVYETYLTHPRTKSGKISMINSREIDI